MTARDEEKNTDGETGPARATAPSANLGKRALASGKNRWRRERKSWRAWGLLGEQGREQASSCTSQPYLTPPWQPCRLELSLSRTHSSLQSHLSWLVRQGHTRDKRQGTFLSRRILRESMETGEKKKKKLERWSPAYHHHPENNTTKKCVRSKNNKQGPPPCPSFPSFFPALHTSWGCGN
jgi:hypothetical protein